MINDFQNQFTIDASNTQRGALETSAANFTAKCIDMDCGTDNGIDWGAGELVVPYVELVSGAASNVVTSLKVDIVASTTKALTGSAVILSTITILAAALTSATGALFPMPALLAGKGLRRYLGCIFTPAGGDGSTGYFVVGLREKSAGGQAFGGSVFS